MPLFKTSLCALFFSVCIICFGQCEEVSSLKATLDSLSESSIPQLNESVDLSLSNIPLSEFIRAISTHVGLNINIDPTLSQKVNNNYAGVKAKDVLVMLCDQYDIDCKIYGGIISLKAHLESNTKFIVEYNKESNMLSFDLKDASLQNFTRELSVQSAYNFFLIGDAKSAQVTGFARSMEPMEALKGLAQSNNLIVNIEGDKLVLIESVIKKEGDPVNGHQDVDMSKQVLVNGQGQITINGDKLSCNNLFQFVTNKLNIPFFQANSIEGEKSISLKNADLESFMNSIVSGTKQTYKFQNGTLYVDDRGKTEMKTTHVFKFYYRRVDSLLVMLPKNIFPNVEMKEFSELNSLLITADADLLADAEQKLRKLDVSVPVVLIDVIILDVKNTEELETSIEAGISPGDNSIEKGGTINPGIDYTMSSGSINNAIAQLGLTKLGKVTPNFYIKLKALEINGMVDIRSTPQLSTLNGHPAVLSIGETQYYEEKRNVYQGSLSPQLETLTSYLPVQAQLGVTIEPFVTGDGDVTLNIAVEQSNFTDRFKEDAPPGLISRNFKSMIRVKNQEMILLGGLEELQKEKTRQGMPGLAKIPIISWLFTSRTSKNNKSRLNIFIKPTILY